MIMNISFNCSQVLGKKNKPQHSESFLYSYSNSSSTHVHEHPSLANIKRLQPYNFHFGEIFGVSLFILSIRYSIPAYQLITSFAGYERACHWFKNLMKWKMLRRWHFHWLRKTSKTLLQNHRNFQNIFWLMMSGISTFCCRCDAVVSQLRKNYLSVGVC